jgi:nitroimidazol reductase NimA-like FMN-containing flavoprotein (pyridoxamine 5'-phosphate oxidase superfamily)
MVKETTMARSHVPVFKELSREQGIAMLESHHVGRLAFTFHDRVDIEPISYVYADGWLYLRTSEGTKLATVHHHPFVAFEIDDVNGRLDWKSVVVRGTIYFLDPTVGGQERAEYDKALELLRSTDAAAMTGTDATPQRNHLFRIYVDEITARSASS